MNHNKLELTFASSTRFQLQFKNLLLSVTFDSFFTPKVSKIIERNRLSDQLYFSPFFKLCYQTFDLIFFCQTPNEILNNWTKSIMSRLTPFESLSSLVLFVNPKNEWSTLLCHVFSYLILAPAAMQAEKDIKKAAGICLETVKLDPEMYRLGHTKARTFSIFRALPALHR